MRKAHVEEGKRRRVMDFKLKIECDNAAFDDDMRDLEVARILREAADRIENGADFGFCIDVNGNRVGSWAFKGEGK